MTKKKHYKAERILCRYDKKCRRFHVVIQETKFEKVCDTKYEKRCYDDEHHHGDNRYGPPKCKDVPR